MAIGRVEMQPHPVPLRLYPQRPWSLGHFGTPFLLVPKHPSAGRILTWPAAESPIPDQRCGPRSLAQLVLFRPKRPMAPDGIFGFARPHSHPQLCEEPKCNLPRGGRTDHTDEGVGVDLETARRGNRLARRVGVIAQCATSPGCRRHK